MFHRGKPERSSLAGIFPLHMNYFNGKKTRIIIANHYVEAENVGHFESLVKLDGDN